MSFKYVGLGVTFVFVAVLRMEPRPSFMLEKYRQTYLVHVKGMALD